MKKLITLIILVIALFFGLASGTEQRATKGPIEVVIKSPDSPWYSPIYFDDLVVVETVTRRPFTINEVMDMLDKLPNVKTVSCNTTRVPVFEIDRLAYPQYAHDFMLSRAKWQALRDYCRSNLTASPYAAEEVRRHWKLISEGTPPFGLKVLE